MATELTKAPEWRRDIEAMTQEFTRSLPGQVPTERFVRTILTAVQLNPELASADRHTLKVACMRAAQDGLLPDGREGALVVYKTSVKRDGRDVYVQAVQWMPMVAGLQKKARNSGEIASLTAHVVYKHDKFRLVFGDEEVLEHEPNLLADDSDMIEANAIGAYAVARLKDGTIVRAWRPRGKILLAKSQSKAANGPMWTKFWEEAWIKTAIRYLTKYLPSSSDKEGADAFARAAQRDDDTYDFNQGKDVTPVQAQIAGGGNRLEALMASLKPAPEHDADGVVQDEPVAQQEPPPPEPPDDTLAELEAAGEAPSLPADAGVMVNLSYPGPAAREAMVALAEAQDRLEYLARNQTGKSGAKWCTEALDRNRDWLKNDPDLTELLHERLRQCQASLKPTPKVETAEADEQF